MVMEQIQVYVKSCNRARKKSFVLLRMYAVIAIAMGGLFLSGCDFFSFTENTQTSDGSSSSSSSAVDFVFVSNQSELEAIANDLTKNYYLRNDIVVVTDNWTPLGERTSTAFSGQFDGNSKTITIKKSDTNTTNKIEWSGLFYGLEAPSSDAVAVKDLKIQLANTIEISESNSGILAKSISRGKVEHVDVFGSKGVYTAAIVSVNPSAGTNIEHVGGLVGKVTSGGGVSLTRISSYLSVSKTDTGDLLNYFGGIIGVVENTQTTMEGLVFKGKIDFPSDKATTKYVGGIVGKNVGTITKSRGEGNVSGRERIGGLVGEDSGTITESMVAGAIVGYAHVGGLVGRTMGSEIHNSYAKGTVKGSYSTGGFIGSLKDAVVHFAVYIGEASDADPTLADNIYTRGVGEFAGTRINALASNAYYLSGMGQVGKLNYSVLGTPKSANDLKLAATYVGFDTLSTWIIKDGSFPMLFQDEPSYLRLVNTNSAMIMDKEFELEFSEPVTIDSSSFTLNNVAIAATDISTSDNVLFRISMNPKEDEINTFEFLVISASETTEVLSNDFTFYYYPNNDGDEYYDISTCKSLQGLRNLVLLSRSFELVQDIDCNDSTTWNVDAGTNVAAGFVPIGGGGVSFEGVLQGNGHTVSNLYINRPNTNNVGLFATTLHSTIESLGILNADITGQDNVGIIAGNQHGTVQKVYTTGKVSGRNNVGGLIGSNGAEISQTYSKASVAGTDNIGGLVGFTQVSIRESYATGAVAGTNNLGGLVGMLINYGMNPVVEKSYYDSTTTGQADAGKGDGKSTADMQKEATYVDWDTAVWNIVDGDYPWFR